MRIMILNGSPKGEMSVTLQTVRYWEKLYPSHEFDVFHVGQKIKQLEKGLQDLPRRMQQADLVLFCYPVYTFIAPYQLHRFIEMVKASGVNLSGKFATQITTSKHFYDVTAHRYVQDNCADMGMKFIRGLSADMDDLLSRKGQQEARDFFQYICWCMAHDVYEPLPASAAPGRRMPVTVPEDHGEKGGDIAVVTTCGEADVQLRRMIERFCAVSPRRVRVINVREYPFKGGCLGCFNCAVDGTCIYKDDFDRFLRDTIQTAEAIVYAFTIRDHSMGAAMKLYDDRQFCNGHRTVTMGMPMGYLISGDYAREMNLNMIVEGRAQVGGNFLAGVATDEQDPDRAIDDLARSLDYALQNRYIPPQNFYGVGGMKIFRDLIWLMQGMMKADHRFYKSHGQYDFPQKKIGTMLKMQLVGALLASPKLKAKAGGMMNQGMIGPYKKVLDEAKPIE